MGLLQCDFAVSRISVGFIAFQTAPRWKNSAVEFASHYDFSGVESRWGTGWKKCVCGRLGPCCKERILVLVGKICKDQGILQGMWLVPSGHWKLWVNFFFWGFYFESYCPISISTQENAFHDSVNARKAWKLKTKNDCLQPWVCNSGT